MSYLQNRGTCHDDPEAGPGPSTARFYSRSDTAAHVRSTSASDEPGLVNSDEDIIFNADTYPTPNDDHQVPAIQPVEEDLAPDVALFLSFNSPRDDDTQTTESFTGNVQEGKKPVRGDETPPSTLTKSYSHPEGDVQSMEMTPQLPRRRAISLDTFDGSGANPQWPRNVPAVRVHQPPFPPPERMPTPPGLPSFGTPEAIAVSARFLHEPDSARRRRDHSPSTAIRRLFGLLPPMERNPSPPPTPGPASAIESSRGIGRAPDGTAVLGRFNPRQSGHGVNLAEGLDDHTFHANNTPAVPAEPSPTGSRRTSVSSFKSTLSLPKRYGRVYRPSIANFFAAQYQDPVSSPTSEPAVTPPRTPPPRNPARLLGQQPQSAGEESISAGTPSPSRGRTESPTRRIVHSTRDVSPLSTSFQMHTVVTETIQEEEPDIGTENAPQRNTAPSRTLSRFPIQIPICCLACSRGSHADHDHANANATTTATANANANHEIQLEVMASRDSYATAETHHSPTRNQSPQHPQPQGNNDTAKQPKFRKLTSAYKKLASRAANVSNQRNPES